MEASQSNLSVIKDTNLTTGYSGTILLTKSNRYNSTQVLAFGFIDFIANVAAYVLAIYLVFLFAYRNLPLLNLMQILMPVSKAYRVNETENAGVSRLKAQLKSLV